MLPDSSPPAQRDWLMRLAPADWIRQALGELARAESSLKTHDQIAGVLGLQRAAGMALNGALCIAWRDWGRTYVDHLHAVAADESVPAAVRDAAQALRDASLQRAPNLVRLTPPSQSAGWVDAAKTVMAHAYAVVHGSAGRGS